jgi:hypothetical protein
MVHIEQWELRQDWLDYVSRSWLGQGRVELVNDDSTERASFADKATGAFSNLGVNVKFLKTYLCVQESEEGEGYIDGHPHYHHPHKAYTLVHYLHAGSNPAKLDIFKSGQVVETITPKDGLTVFFKNNVIHGVHKHKGQDKRIALIATALV